MYISIMVERKIKRANNLYKQYGKQIRATEKVMGSCVVLGRYGYDNFKDLEETAKLHKGFKKIK